MVADRVRGVLIYNQTLLLWLRSPDYSNEKVPRNMPLFVNFAFFLNNVIKKLINLLSRLHHLADT